MNKEMFISSSPHETKVAVCEDGQLVEVYFERDTDVGLVGGIYKGRVNRVLPGMQSAFVDIGLERDAFLYVSDFSLQDQDEFEGVLDEAQTRPAAIEIEPQKPTAQAGAAGSEKKEKPDQVGPGGEAAESAEQEEISATTAVAVPAPAEASRLQPSNSSAGPSGEGKDFRRRSHRGRRRRGRHGRHGDRRQDHRPEPQAEAPKPEPAPESEGFEVLPGESLAKYSHPDAEEPAMAEASAQTGVEELDSEHTTVVERAEAGASTTAVAPSGSLQIEESTDETKGETYSEDEEERAEASLVSADARASDASSAHGEEVEETTAEAAEYQTDTKDKGDAAPGNSAQLESESEEEKSRTDESASSGPENELQAEGRTASGEDLNPEEKSENEARADGDSEGASESSDERSYTLREPHARPHFAPRRGRRGRRRAGKHSRRSSSREHESSRAGSQQGLQISELLKEGQEIIVQIAKEPLGTKGARITSHVALPGRYVVYMPTITHIGVSRKIASEQERLRLRNIVMEHKGTLGGGFIVRTAGEGRTDDEIKADLQFLTNLWNDIRTRAEQVKAPALLYRDLDLAQRLMRDLVTPDFKSIWLDNETEYERVVEFVNRLQPSLVGCAKLHTRSNPLFEEHGIEDEIAKALKPKVWLKSGGYIVINQTEALVAIDVNTGKYVGKTNRLEDTIVKTNVDAINEIVRQIRLRDLGGIIVIDFIDMDERRNRNKVVQALEEALRRDRAPTKVLSFNDFGLVAVTRKRVKQSLERTLCDPCTYCNGSGWVKSVSTVTYEILAEARKMAEEIEGKTMTLRVNPEVAHELKSKEGSLVREIETLTHKNLVIKSDPTIHQERFEIF